MQRRTLAPVQWIVLGLLGCSAGGGGTTSQAGGSASTGGSSVSSSSTIGGQASGGGAGGSATTATGGTNGNVGGAGGSTGGSATGGNGVTGGTSSVSSAAGGKTSTGGSASTGGTSSNAGGTSVTGGTKAVGGSANTGGTTTTGGTTSTGGSATVGGASPIGGSAATGGATTGQGGTSTGGSSSTAPSWPTCSITDVQIQSAYTSWSGTYVSSCSSGGKRVVGCGSSTCSEAMGYGMLIAVNSGHQDMFNSLWTFVDSLIPVSSAGGTVAGNNLMPWDIKDCTTVNDYNNATDGDLDIAMALVQADARWPGNGYLDNAVPIIKDILNKNTALSGSNRVLLMGAKQNISNGGHPGYFAPGYYQVFIDIFKRSAYADSAQVQGWTELLNATYPLLSAGQTSLSNKLWPDYWPLDGSTSSGQAFGWDSCRAPWRIATDYAWFSSASASSALLTARAVQANPYTAAPTKNSAFVGALAFTAMPAGATAFQTACDQWLGGQLSDAMYFQDSLKLIYMLLAGGFFPSTL